MSYCLFTKRELSVFFLIFLWENTGTVKTLPSPFMFWSWGQSFFLVSVCVECWTRSWPWQWWAKLPRCYFACLECQRQFSSLKWNSEQWSVRNELQAPGGEVPSTLLRKPQWKKKKVEVILWRTMWRTEVNVLGISEDENWVNSIGKNSIRWDFSRKCLSNKDPSTD